MSEHSGSMDIDEQHMEIRSSKASAGGEKKRVPDGARVACKMPRSLKETPASKVPEEPEVPQVKVHRKKRVMTPPTIHRDGKLYHPRYKDSVASLDNEWGGSTWHSRASKADLLYLLEYAGEDISIVKTWKSETVCRYVVAVRKDREDRRQNGTTGNVHASAFLTNMATTWAAAEVDTVGTSTDEDVVDDGGVDADTNAVDPSDVDAEGETDDDLMAGPEIAAYYRRTANEGDAPIRGEEDDAFGGDGSNLIEGEEPAPLIQKSTTSKTITKAKPDPKASRKPRLRRTMTLSRARDSLLSIQQQAYSDARNSAFPDYDSYIMAHVFVPVRDTTLIRDRNGNVVFSHHTQMLVRDVIQARDTARVWRDRKHIEQGNEAANLCSVKVGRKEMCERLIAVLTDWLEVEGVDAKEQAKNLVDELLDM